MSDELKHEAAGLLLSQAIADMSSALHAGDMFDGWSKWDQQTKNGDELARRCRGFSARIETAVKRYERCREFYNESKP